MKDTLGGGRKESRGKKIDERSLRPAPKQLSASGE